MINSAEQIRSEVLFADRWPLGDTTDLQFRLFYEGPLPAETSKPRPIIKHAIRRYLHPQLLALWKQQHILKNYFDIDPLSGASSFELIGRRFERGKYKFVPTITEDSGFWCSLDILFLRRDVPGNLIKSGGDMDNRLKVLFDALAIPTTTDGWDNGEVPEEENPMCCLLEDDKLITDLNVTTDRLLTPVRDGGKEGDVKLVIHVRTSTFDLPSAVSYLGQK